MNAVRSEIAEVAGPSGGEAWPTLPYAEWQDTYETLHMWTQIVGKIRMALSPMVNHWWQVTLYVTMFPSYGWKSYQLPFKSEGVS